MTLRELRLEKGLTQVECAKYLNMPRRTYCRYEAEESNRAKSFKYNYIMKKLGEYGVVDEEHGLLTIEKIKMICMPIFREYNVEYAYLFGSYAKGTERDRSDVDLLISVDADGFEFHCFIEKLREALHKRVDALDLAQLKNNLPLTNEILKDGIKIY